MNNIFKFFLFLSFFSGSIFTDVQKEDSVLQQESVKTKTICKSWMTRAGNSLSLQYNPLVKQISLVLVLRNSLPKNLSDEILSQFKEFLIKDTDEEKVSYFALNLGDEVNNLEVFVKKTDDFFTRYQDIAPSKVLLLSQDSFVSENVSSEEKKVPFKINFSEMKQILADKKALFYFGAPSEGKKLLLQDELEDIFKKHLLVSPLQMLCQNDSEVLSVQIKDLNAKYQDFLKEAQSLIDSRLQASYEKLPDLIEVIKSNFGQSCYFKATTDDQFFGNENFQVTSVVDWLAQKNDLEQKEELNGFDFLVTLNLEQDFFGLTDLFRLANEEKMPKVLSIGLSKVPPYLNEYDFFIFSSLNDFCDADFSSQEDESL